MRRTGMVVVLALLLSGCTSTIGGSATTGAPPTAARSALAVALSRVPATALGKDGYFEFGDSARLRQLAGSQAAMWKFQTNAGAGSLGSYVAFTRSVIGVDLSSAEVALTVGQPPQLMTVLVGGQNPSTITSAATRSGWAGGEVLSKDLDLSKGSAAVAGITLAAPNIRPLGTDVVLSQLQGDPAGVAAAGAVAGSPADQLPAMKVTIACLGDLPTAFGTGIGAADPADLTAVGAGPGTGGTAATVICLGAADRAGADSLAAEVRVALTSGQSKASGRPWKELLQSAEVDVVAGSPAVVRIRASTSTAAVGLQLMQRQDIPGR